MNLFYCILGVEVTQNRGAVFEYAEGIGGSTERQTPPEN